MSTDPSTRFSNMNWLNFNHDHFSKLSKNTFETILIAYSIVAGLYRYQKIRKKFLKSLKALKCSLGDDRIQLVLWCVHNLPVFLNLKNVVALCGPNNLLLDSPEDIADGILEIARSFKKAIAILLVVIHTLYTLLYNYTLVLVITCLRGRFETNCRSVFLKILELPK